MMPCLGEVVTLIQPLFCPENILTSAAYIQEHFRLDFS